MSDSHSRRQTYASAIAVERAADILFLLARRGEVSVTELGVELGVGGSAVHRILVALSRRGLVDQNVETQGYRLGWRAVTLAHSGGAQDDVRAVALPQMQILSKLTHETVHLSVRSGFERVSIERVESDQDVRFHAPIGRIDPLYVGASGKLLLAYMSDKDRKWYFAHVLRRRVTPYTERDAEKLEEECAKIRLRGIALSNQDDVMGAVGIAAPIFDHLGAVIAALTIVAPTRRGTARQLRAWSIPIINAAQIVSARLGHLADPDLGVAQ